MIGKILGSYRIDAPLGRGGMAEVYRAHQLTLRRDVALKVIRPELRADAETTARFRREWAAMAHLTGPHLIRVFDEGEADGLHYLAMELMNAPTLAGTPADLARALKVGVELCEALDEVHAAGFIHRDVKPINVFWHPARGAVLADFGLARRITDESHLTEPGVVLGTVSYMAPEQLRGPNITPAIDVYAVALIVYELIAGTSPFRARDVAGMVRAIMRETPPDLRSLAPETPHELASVIARALAKDPGQRPASAREFGAQLARFQKKRPPIRTRRVPVLPRAGHPFVALPVGLAVGLAVALLLKPPPARPPVPAATQAPQLDHLRDALRSLDTSMIQKSLKRLGDPAPSRAARAARIRQELQAPATALARLATDLRVLAPAFWSAAPLAERLALYNVMTLAGHVDRLCESQRLQSATGFAGVDRGPFDLELCEELARPEVVRLPVAEPRTFMVPFAPYEPKLFNKSERQDVKVVLRGVARAKRVELVVETIGLATPVYFDVAVNGRLHLVIPGRPVQQVTHYHQFPRELLDEGENVFTFTLRAAPGEATMETAYLEQAWVHLER